MELLHSFLRCHFAGKPMLALQNIGCLLRLIRHWTPTQQTYIWLLIQGKLIFVLQWFYALVNPVQWMLRFLVLGFGVSSLREIISGKLCNMTCHLPAIGHFQDGDNRLQLSEFISFLLSHLYLSIPLRFEQK